MSSEEPSSVNTKSSLSKGHIMTIYYECGFPAELVPVEFIGWERSPLHHLTGCINAVVRLKRKPMAVSYYKGEVLHVPSYRVVEKAGIRNYNQLVRPAALPPVGDANLLPARW